MGHNGSERFEQPARAKAASLHAQSQARDFPFHGRRTEPSGTLRLQTPSSPKWNGKVPPAELVKGYRAAFINPSATLLGPKFKFAKHGQSGAELSELLPHLAEVVDDIVIVKSMHTDAFNHAPGQIFNEHRHAAIWAAQHGGVGDLWAGK